MMEKWRGEFTIAGEGKERSCDRHRCRFAEKGGRENISLSFTMIQKRDERERS